MMRRREFKTTAKDRTKQAFTIIQRRGRARRRAGARAGSQNGGERSG
jgi:hypothetical protein